MRTFFDDLRLALRVLRKTPAFSLAAILVLAASIGVNTAVFGFVNALVLRPMMGRDQPGEVVGVYSRDRAHPDAYRTFSYASYRDIRDRNDVFSDVMAFGLTFAGIREGDVTRPTLVSTVSDSYFSTLGVRLAVGRGFTVEEARPGSAAAVVVLSHEYWRSHGADPAILGRTVYLNARPFAVVGVAPRGFTGTAAVVAPELWLPTGVWEMVTDNQFRGDPGLPLSDRRNNALMVVGRLKPGVSQAAAAPRLARLSLEMERDFPAENRNQELLVRTLPRLTLSSAPQSDRASMGYALIVMAMAAVVLLIGALNLANMVLARSTVRRQEIAVRLALGASRATIVRQLVTEGAVLSTMGGAGGLLVAYWSSRLLWASLAALSPFPMQFDPMPDARVVAATLGFCAFSTVVFSLGPAWRLAGTDVWLPLKSQGGDGIGLRATRRWRTRDLLVATQIALSLALLTAGGLFVRGAFNATASDPGYRLEQRAVASLDASLAGYDEPHGRLVYRRVLERVRSLPGVESASPSSLVALGMNWEGKTVRQAGAGPAGQSAVAVYAVIGRAYFRTLGLAILRGRDFTESEEQAAGPAVAVIDQPLAARLFGRADPVGHEIEISDEPGASSRALVVGVAPGLRQSLWDKAPVAHVYVPFGQAYRAGTQLHLKLAAGAPEADLLRAVRREIRAADERLPVLSIKTLTEHRDTTTVYWAIRAMAVIFTTFGMLALLLAVVGIYAVKAYLVARRTREIGIRIALGSTGARVLGLVLREGAGLTLGGLAAGFLIALGIGRLVGSVLYEVRAFDPLVFILAPLVLGAATLVACYLPARRAARLAPTTALRAE